MVCLVSLSGLGLGHVDFVFCIERFAARSLEGLVELQTQMSFLELLCLLGSECLKQKQHDVSNVAFNELINKVRLVNRAYHRIDLVSLAPDVLEDFVDRFTC